MSFAGRLARLITLVAAGLLSACGKPPVQQQESFVFGTRVEVLVAGESEAKARSATAAVLREFDRLHRTYHAWQPSELSALNAAFAAGRQQTVTPEMAAFLGEARELSHRGGGLFDPGIGELIQLWGFHADEYQPVLPAAADIEAWRAAKAGIADLHLDGLVASSGNRHLAIDLGGYLKGVALDHAAAILRAEGIHNALINIGGNVMALGTKNGEAWKVGIQNPRQPGPLATLALRDGEAIGTSGDYQRFFEVDGQRYCHLIDPRTGQPVTHTQALTVLIPPQEKAGTYSDAMTKPIFIAGDHWRATARQLGVANVLRVDAAGHILLTRPMRERLEFVADPPPAVEIVP